MKTKNTLQFPRTLRDLYSHPDFIPFPRSSDEWIHDPDRMQRCLDAAEHGAEGSTHAEIISDWREFLETLRSDALRQAAFHPRIEAWIESLAEDIEAEISACESWHESQGTLHAQIG